MTEAEKADVRYYLGWSERFHQTDSRLEQALSAIATTPDGEALVLADIASCKDIDAKLVNAHGRLKALKVGSINLPGSKEIDELCNEGRRFVGRISSRLGVEVRHDVFGSALPVAAGGNYALHG